MTAPRLSLGDQRTAIEACLAALDCAEPGKHSALIDAARQGCLTLAWIERREELVRSIARLDQAAPSLREIMRAFPDAPLMIRRTDGHDHEPLSNGELSDDV